MSSRELYTLLHLLELLDGEVGSDEPAHLAVTILKIQAEKLLSERPRMG